MKTSIINGSEVSGLSVAIQSEFGGIVAGYEDRNHNYSQRSSPGDKAIAQKR